MSDRRPRTPQHHQQRSSNSSVYRTPPSPRSQTPPVTGPGIPSPTSATTIVAPSPRHTHSTGSIRRSVSPSPAFARKPVPSYIPAPASTVPAPPVTPPPVSPGAREGGQPEFDTLNFHRRPSTAFDPSAATRSLVSPMSTTTIPAGGQPHRRKGSHSRQPSISLASPTSSGSHYTASPSPASNAPLPPEPVPTRTRAPLESFASVEMLQGAREVAARRRGSEVFRDGRYEGRGITPPLPFNFGQGGGSMIGEAPNSQRRGPAPDDHVRQARGSNRLAQGAALLPSIDVDLANIASQLREHDQRRGSVDDYRRFSVVDGAFEQSPTSAEPSFIPTPNFAFPARPMIGASVSTPSFIGGTPAPPYTLDEVSSDDDLSPYIDDKSYSNEKDIKWKTEPLGTSASGGAGGSGGSFVNPRPSIVALPVYPAPSGALARSLKFRARKSARYLTWLTVLLAQTAVVLYLYKRTTDLVEVERRRPGIFLSAWVFLVVEMIVAAVVGISSIWKVVSYKASSSEPKLRLRGDKNLPAVDVFVVSCGQTDQLTFDCAIAAASMDYPAHRFRVMVLDPTNSAVLQRDIVRHAKSQGCPHLSYHARVVESGGKKGDIHAQKQNSINFGMREAAVFGHKGPADYIAVIDADMIPERNFLRAALPSLLSDQQCALVKTGQGFINLPLRLAPSTSLLMNATEPTSHVRSGFVLRRSALNEIGGFPTDSWIQDGHCEALLLGHGYNVATVDEVLQWGMAKPTYAAQTEQMMINRLGRLRTAWRLRFFMGKDTKMMPLWDRLKGIGRALDPFLGVLFMLVTIAYPFMYSYGGLLVLTPTYDSLNLLLRLTLAMIGLLALHELTWSWSTGLPSPRQDLQKWLFIAPYQFVGLMYMALPPKLWGYKRGSDLDLNIVVEPTRPSIWRRAWLMFWDPHSGVVVAFVTAIGVAIWRATKDFERGDVDYHQTALTMLLTVAWPSLLWVEFIYSSVVPYSCLLFPSRLLTEKREAFLIRDTFSSVARPKHAFKSAQPFRTNHYLEFITAGLVIGWATACVVLGSVTDVFA